MAEKQKDKKMMQVFLPTSIEKFSPEKGKWIRWVKRLETAFQLFNITKQEEMKNMALHYMGMEAYDKLCDIVSPKEPEEMKYLEIVAKLEEYYDPKPVEATECFNFHSRKQAENESVTDFMGALRKLAKDCNFGCSKCENLNKTLRNQFIIGLRSRAMQNRLLEKHDLTIEKALELAVAMEASDKSSQIIASTTAKPSEIRVEVNELKIPEKEDIDVQQVAGGGTPGKVFKCYRCGLSNHNANKCFHVNTVCRNCGKVGHLQKVCKQSGEKKRMNQDGQPQKGSKEVHGIEGIFSMEEEHTDKVLIDVKCNEKLLQFEMDSGSAISIAGIDFRDKFFPTAEIMTTTRKFVSYGGNGINVLGFIKISPKIGGRVLRNANLYLSEESSRRPLLGREWIKKMKWFDWNSILEINKAEEKDSEITIQGMIEKLKKDNPKVFEKSRGKIEGIQAELRLKDNAKPVFIKERSVAFSKKKAVEDEIKKLVDDGVLKKVNQSRWATPIVPIYKASGGVRLCGDYSVTLNPELVIDQHPLPTIDELFSDMAGGDKFTKLDLSQAYLQLEVREQDRELLTLSTHLGLYEPTRLMYGVAPAVAVWQRLMENELKDIPGVKVFLDDIKITGPDDQTHFARVNEVLKRLNNKNMRVNKDKCEFFKDKIEYLGYVIDKRGIHKDRAKIEALQEMPRPTNKDEVRAFLGFVNYYGRFFKNLSTTLSPIYNLLKGDDDKGKIVWDKKCSEAWKKIKYEMVSDKFLDHYNPQLELILATDASPVGVGACISQRYPDGTEKPLQYGSRSLTQTQRNYSQLDREAYGIIFGMKKFFPYLFGRKFTLITDNKPLSHILNPKKGIPLYTAMRLQHYAAFLQGFQFDIQYRKSEEHGNVDCLSRLPLKETSGFEMDEVDAVQIHFMEKLPVTITDIKTETEKNNDVTKLMKALQTGQVVKKEHRFGIEQSEFGIMQGCLMKGGRVYIPPSLRDSILGELHEGHFGVSRMKAMARNICWWPNIDKHIEEKSKNCSQCQERKADPVKDKTHVWEDENEPFTRIHVDYAGPIHGKYLLILVDAYSKWPEVKVCGNQTAETTVSKLREIFSTHGLPRVVVSDQGRQFMSEEFQEFCKMNGIIHKTGSPYHPATNGQAERYVRTFKEKLEILKEVESQDLERKLANLLLIYRTTPHATTGVTPSSRLMNREIRTRLDLIRPDQEKVVKEREQVEVKRELRVDDRVAARNYVLRDLKWKFGRISRRLGKVHYLVRLDDGRIWKRHINQLRKIGEFVGTQNSQGESIMDRSYWDVEENTNDIPDQTLDRNDLDENDNSEDAIDDLSAGSGGVSSEGPNELQTDGNQIILRRSCRQRKPPIRLNL